MPVGLEIVLFLINLFVPDSIPLLDEILMVLPAVKKMRTLVKVQCFYEDHKAISKIFIIALLGLCAFGLWALIWK